MSSYTSPRDPAAPTAFSAYASRFLSSSRTTGGDRQQPTDSEIFRPPSPGSPTHDPFLPSPTASATHPRLAGSSSTSTGSPERTPPFPGIGIDGIPSIPYLDESRGGESVAAGAGAGAGTSSSSIGVGLLFDAPVERAPPKPNKVVGYSVPPDPYGPSSDSEGEMEADLDQVHQVRRSLLRPINQDRNSGRNSRAKKGWLAYQSVFPSSSDSEASESEKETEADSEGDDDDERFGMMGQSRHHRSQQSRDSGVLPQLATASETLEEPLLGPDEITHMTTKVPVRLQVYHGRFGHWEREGLRKYKDPGFLALWMFSVLAVLFGLLFVWGPHSPPEGKPTKTPPSILPLLPLLIALIVPSLILPPIFLFLLSKTVRPVLMATAVSVPFSLFVCGWWAIGASFESIGDANQQDRWWATTGLRLSAVLCWLLAALFARLVWVRRRKLERTVTVVELATHLLLRHPPMLLLTPLLLAIFAVMSIPFLTMLIRLGMIGYWGRSPQEGTYAFHVYAWSGWLMFFVTVVWVWTWGVLRGVGRVAVAGVVGEWYFHRETGLDPLEITTAAVHRATGTSLGSICQGSLIVATVRVVGRAANELKRITSPRSKVLPSALSFLHALTPFFTMVASILDQLNGYALVHVGITGEAFWPSARRAVGLASRRNSGKLLDYTLIKLLLTLSSTATGCFTATAGYLYMAHTLGSPSYAPVAALLCGGVPFLAIRSGAAVLGDAADALFICHQIDNESGGAHCDEARKAFAGGPFRADDLV